MSVEIVTKAIADILSSGVSINGPCGAFGIANLVAFRTGLGVLFKPRPTENNCIHNGVGYAADIVMNREGQIWDMLFDGGGENKPVWNQKEDVDKNWYRDPVLNHPILFVVPNSNNNQENKPPPVVVENNNQSSDGLTIDFMVRQLHLKMDDVINRVTITEDGMAILLMDYKNLDKKLEEVKLKQDRALVGSVGMRLRLVPEEK